MSSLNPLATRTVPWALDGFPVTGTWTLVAATSGVFVVTASSRFVRAGFPSPSDFDRPADASASGRVVVPASTNGNKETSRHGQGNGAGTLMSEDADPHRSLH